MFYKNLPKKYKHVKQILPVAVLCPRMHYNFAQ